MLMKQKKMLVLTFSQLKQIYTQEMPGLVEMAAVSPTVEDFKAGLLRHLDSCGVVNEVAEEAREQIRLLLQYDGQDVHELSTGQDISVQTIRLLYLNPEKPDVPLNKNDAFQKVQKRHVQEKR